MNDLSARARPRKTLACVLCRTRKVKCSGEIPCKGCISRNVECIVIDGKKRGPPLGYVRAKKITKAESPEETPRVYPPITISRAPKISLDNPIVESDGVELWNHENFRRMEFDDEDGGRLSFIDYYFKWVHRTLPFLSKDWVESNFHLLPPYFLHAMYAKLAVTPLTKQKLESKAYLTSYNYAKKHLLLDLGEIDPFVICALLHLSSTSASTGKTHELLNLFSRVLSGSLHLGLPLDREPVWNPNQALTLNDINFGRSMWLYIYAFGYQGSAIYDLPMPEVPDIPLQMIEQFVSPNRNHPTNIPQNALSYYHMHIPLVTIGRKIKRHLLANGKFDDHGKHLLEQLDSWYACLPIIYKAHDDDISWLGRFLANLNMLYHYQRLMLLKSDFLVKIENGDVDNRIVKECQASAITLICINRAFILAKPSGIEDQSVMHKMVIYMAGMFYMAISSVTGKDVNESVNLLIEACRMISSGPKFDVEMEKCLGDYKLAVGLLRRFRNCNVY